MESKIKRKMYSNFIQQILPNQNMDQEQQLRSLAPVVQMAKDYALINGISMRTKESYEDDSVVLLPFTLFPSPFPKKSFEYVKFIQRDINLLLHRVAYNYEFLCSCLKNAIQTDEFTANLFSIYEEVIKEGFAQPLSLGLFRSDYMLNSTSNDVNFEDLEIKQVEVNTIASSFGGLASRLESLHRLVLNQCGCQELAQKIPVNPAVSRLAEGLVAAWEVYGKSEAVILFVVEEETYNISDQRCLEFAVREKRKDIHVTRQKFSELQLNAVLKEKRLHVKNQEVAVVYFRTGYVPDQYSKQDWKLRLLIEKSRAIKCPSIQYHLAGTKKVQQELSRPGIMEKLFKDVDYVKRVRNVFAGQYSLDLDSSGDEIVIEALQNPQNYVMKPQREGGGYNIYGKQVKTKLTELGRSKEREAYILMERIKPPSTENYIIQRKEPPTKISIIGELGIFGVILGNQEDVLVNNEAGHLLRSKKIGIDEGGIAAGYGQLDSPLLF
ncbi:glutathione synthetase-like isoform X1 [Tachypleus tridentatus]|uniref:glutathione synthetase-like isoform X1 n=1 Tax=Tachypleus tridentatus TaxID=6853 RepID=UPI003FD41D56